MKTAAVLIENWKLPIFTRHLRKAGFSYDTAQGLTAGTLNLKVSYESVEALQPVIQAAQDECAMRYPK